MLTPGTTDDGGNTRGGCGPAKKTETIEKRDTKQRLERSLKPR